MERQHCSNPRFRSYLRDLEDGNRESVRSTFLLLLVKSTGEYPQLVGFSRRSNDEIRRRKDILGIPLGLVSDLRECMVRLDLETRNTRTGIFGNMFMCQFRFPNPIGYIIHVHVLCVM